jgi:serine/threonine protein kinase
MTLPAGTRLGPYQIEAPLGAGGMGEVYRARDTRLGRDVAIKVLPPTLSVDTDRLRRFETEARSASSLNHPNIVTIHDIGESGGTSFIAMEMVDGQTLRELLAEGPLPTKRLLAITAQVADGLAKAHGAGIVHRDLKPENVMVTRDGFVKILDFGLAKLTQPEEPEGRTQAPTMSGETAVGTVMGTVGYMSPEQAMGRPVDFRSDHFSFGSIVYELATGKRAFARDSVPETLTAIIRDEPEPPFPGPMSRRGNKHAPRHRSNVRPPARGPRTRRRWNPIASRPRRPRRAHRRRRANPRRVGRANRPQDPRRSPRKSSRSRHQIVPRLKHPRPAVSSPIPAPRGVGRPSTPRGPRRDRGATSLPTRTRSPTKKSPEGREEWRTS